MAETRRSAGPRPGQAGDAGGHRTWSGGISRPGSSTASGTATAPRSRPARQALPGPGDGASATRRPPRPLQRLPLDATRDRTRPNRI